MKLSKYQKKMIEEIKDMFAKDDLKFRSEIKDEDIVNIALTILYQKLK